MENGLENVFIQNSVAVAGISYLIAAKALLRLMVFNFTVEPLFEGGALSIECNRILLVFKGHRGTYLRPTLIRVYMVSIALEGFITFVVNFYYI